MNIRKLEDLSKDELIELIKQEREACGKLVPISVDERLPEAIGTSAPWPDDVLIFTAYNKNFVAYYDHKFAEWYDNGELVNQVTHWMPIPEIEE